MRGPDAAGQGATGPGQQPLDVSGSESRIWGGVTAVRSGGAHAGSSMGDSSPGDHDGEMYVTQRQGDVGLGMGTGLPLTAPHVTGHRGQTWQALVADTVPPSGGTAR